MAKIHAFKKLQSSSAEFNKFQDNVEQVFSSVLTNPILDYTIIKEATISTGQANLISHKLGREPFGFIVIRKRADARIWDNQDNNTFKKQTIDIRSSADVVVDLFIF